ncbi:MAG: hypothetical protein AB8G95_19695 [Anaerolineae bacterium]
MADQNKNHKLEVEFTDEVLSAPSVEAELADSELTISDNAQLAAIPQFIQDPAKAHNTSTKTIGHYLAGAKRALAAADTAPHLANSPALSTPVLGKLWGRIRSQMHDLVLFYVNRSAVTHSRVDAQLIEAVEALTQIVERQQAEIDQLKQTLEQSQKDSV